MSYTEINEQKQTINWTFIISYILFILLVSYIAYNAGYKYGCHDGAVEATISLLTGR